MHQHVPNALTALRLLLAVVFFVLLSNYQYEPRGDSFLLNAAFLIYAVAWATDFLDGYLARRWKAEGDFGRIVDPFVDKVLVLGAFIFFAGKNFTIPFFDPQTVPTNVQTITGVAPWMVVVILGRELLVTTLRGESEAGGISFGAAFTGKLKMGFQSFTILIILIYVNYRGWLIEKDYERLGRIVRDICIWITIGITVLSSLQYIQKAVAIYRVKH